MCSKPAWRANLVLAALTLLLLALAIEGVARVAVELNARRWDRTPVQTRRFHPVLGWERIPGTELHVSRAEYDVTLRFNAKGLRGPDVPYERPAGVRRVLLLGDSFTEGYYAEEHETVRAVLENALGERDGCGPVQVINGGRLGYSTDQEYLFYVTEGHRYDPQLTVLLFYYNDLLYNTLLAGTAGEPKPMFVPASDPETPAPGALVPPKQPPHDDGAPAAAPRPRPWRGSIALRLLSNRTESGNPWLHRQLARLGWVEPPRLEEPRELWPFGPWHRAEVDEMWDRTHAILTALQREVTQRAGRLVLLYVPVRFEVNDAVWKLTRERYNWGRRWDRQAVFNRLAAFCRSLDVPLVDTRAALAEAEGANRPAYYVRDVHWNATGNAIAARVLTPVARAQLGCRP